MELTGLEPRRSDLARGIVIARSARAARPARSARCGKRLGRAASPKPTRKRRASGSRGRTPTPRSSASGSPRRGCRRRTDRARAPAHRARGGRARATTSRRSGASRSRPGSTASTWLELTAEPSRREDDGRRAARIRPSPSRSSTRSSTSSAEVLYAAPDAPPRSSRDDEDDRRRGRARGRRPATSRPTITVGALESHWRNGAPPIEHSVRVPDRALSRDHRRLRLGELRHRAQARGRRAARRGVGDQRVLRAVAVGLPGRARRRVRAVPARRRRPRSQASLRADVGRALRGARRPPSDQVHFLLWIVARINDILPLAWARFESVDDAVKSRAVTDDDTEPFVLAGNPFAERFRRHGEEARARVGRLAERVEPSRARRHADRGRARSRSG